MHPTIRALCLAVLVAVPCFWQAHIPSTDLPSHLYGISLAQTVQATPVSGLTLASVSTNALSERLWSPLRGILGGRWLEGSLPAVAVEVFFWGALFWIRRATGAWAWPIAPLAAMVSYGVIFHLGFLNFFLSTGLVLWCIGLLWRYSLRGAAAATGLAGIAWFAHALPVLWAASVLLCIGLLRSILPARRPWALVAGLIALVAARLTLTAAFPTRSAWDVEPPLALALGGLSTDQVWVFGPKYLVVAVALSIAVAVWVFRQGAGLLQASETFPLWALHGAAFLLLPSAVRFRDYHHAATFLPERISLFGACVLLLWLAQNVPGPRLVAVGVPLAGLFFSFLYADGAAYNTTEEQVRGLTRTISAGQRVVAPIYDRDSRVQPLLHAIDRACMGHCLSYGHYEPATGQFHLQATGENPLVAWSMADIQSIENGSYIVPPTQAPLYALCSCEAGSGLCVFRKTAGERTCASTWPVSPRWW